MTRGSEEAQDGRSAPGCSLLPVLPLPNVARPQRARGPPARYCQKPGQITGAALVSKLSNAAIAGVPQSAPSEHPNSPKPDAPQAAPAPTHSTTLADSAGPMPDAPSPAAALSPSLKSPTKQRPSRISKPLAAATASGRPMPRSTQAVLAQPVQTAVSTQVAANAQAAAETYAPDNGPLLAQVAANATQAPSDACVADNVTPLAGDAQMAANATQAPPDTCTVDNITPVGGGTLAAADTCQALADTLMADACMADDVTRRAADTCPAADVQVATSTQAVVDTQAVATNTQAAADTRTAATRAHPAADMKGAASAQLAAGASASGQAGSPAASPPPSRPPPRQAQPTSLASPRSGDDEQAPSDPAPSTTSPGIDGSAGTVHVRGVGPGCIPGPDGALARKDLSHTKKKNDGRRINMGVQFYSVFPAFKDVSEGLLDVRTADGEQGTLQVKKEIARGRVNAVYICGLDQLMDVSSAVELVLKAGADRQVEVHLVRKGTGCAAAGRTSPTKPAEEPGQGAAAPAAGSGTDDRGEGRPRRQRQKQQPAADDQQTAGEADVHTAAAGQTDVDDAESDGDARKRPRGSKPGRKPVAQKDQQPAADAAGPSRKGPRDKQHAPGDSAPASGTRDVLHIHKASTGQQGEELLRKTLTIHAINTGSLAIPKAQFLAAFPEFKQMGECILHLRDTPGKSWEMRAVASKPLVHIHYGEFKHAHDMQQGDEVVLRVGEGSSIQLEVQKNTAEDDEEASTSAGDDTAMKPSNTHKQEQHEMDSGGEQPAGVPERSEQERTRVPQPQPASDVDAAAVEGPPQHRRAAAGTAQAVRERARRSSDKAPTSIPHITQVISDKATQIGHELVRKALAAADCADKLRIPKRQFAAAFPEFQEVQECILHVRDAAGKPWEMRLVDGAQPLLYWGDFRASHDLAPGDTVVLRVEEGGSIGLHLEKEVSGGESDGAASADEQERAQPSHRTAAHVPARPGRKRGHAATAALDSTAARSDMGNALTPVALPGGKARGSVQGDKSPQDVLHIRNISRDAALQCGHELMRKALSPSDCDHIHRFTPPRQQFLNAFPEMASARECILHVSDAAGRAWQMRAVDTRQGDGRRLFVYHKEFKNDNDLQPGDELVFRVGEGGSIQVELEKHRAKPESESDETSEDEAKAKRVRRPTRQRAAEPDAQQPASSPAHHRQRLEPAPDSNPACGGKAEAGSTCRAADKPPLRSTQHALEPAASASGAVRVAAGTAAAVKPPRIPSRRLAVPLAAGLVQPGTAARRRKVLTSSERESAAEDRVDRHLDLFESTPEPESFAAPAARSKAEEEQAHQQVKRARKQQQATTSESGEEDVDAHCKVQPRPVRQPAAARNGTAQERGKANGARAKKSPAAKPLSIAPRIARKAAASINGAPADAPAKTIAPEADATDDEKPLAELNGRPSRVAAARAPSAAADSSEPGCVVVQRHNRGRAARVQSPATTDADAEDAPGVSDAAAAAPAGQPLGRRTRRKPVHVQSSTDITGHTGAAESDSGGDEEGAPPAKRRRKTAPKPPRPPTTVSTAPQGVAAPARQVKPRPPTAVSTDPEAPAAVPRQVKPRQQAAPGKGRAAGTAEQSEASEDEEGAGEGGLKHTSTTRVNPVLRYTKAFTPGDRPPDVNKAFKNRTALVNAAGTQLTKSCHICQNQHFYFKCKKGRPGCMNSYCRQCVAHHFQQLTWDEAMECCPKCRGICSCKLCLRRMHCYVPPRFTQEQQQEYARYLLRCVGPAIQDMLQEAEQQAKAAGLPGLEGVRYEPPVEQQRVQCDACATSICDYHWRCADCLNGAPAAPKPPAPLQPISAPSTSTQALPVAAPGPSDKAPPVAAAAQRQKRQRAGQGGIETQAAGASDAAIPLPASSSADASPDAEEEPAGPTAAPGVTTNASGDTLRSDAQPQQAATTASHDAGSAAPMTDTAGGSMQRDAAPEPLVAAATVATLVTCAPEPCAAACAAGAGAVTQLHATSDASLPRRLAPAGEEMYTSYSSDVSPNEMPSSLPGPHTTSGIGPPESASTITDSVQLVAATPAAAEDGQERLGTAACMEGITALEAATHTAAMTRCAAGSEDVEPTQQAAAAAAPESLQEGAVAMETLRPAAGVDAAGVEPDQGDGPDQQPTPAQPTTQDSMADADGPAALLGAAGKRSRVDNAAADTAAQLDQLAGERSPAPKRWRAAEAAPEQQPQGSAAGQPCATPAEPYAAAAKGSAATQHQQPDAVHAAASPEGSETPRRRLQRAASSQARQMIHSLAQEEDLLEPLPIDADAKCEAEPGRRLQRTASGRARARIAQGADGDEEMEEAPEEPQDGAASGRGARQRRPSTRVKEQATKAAPAPEEAEAAEPVAEDEDDGSNEVDICVRCYGEQSKQPGGPRCPRCLGSHLGMASFIDKRALKTLRKIAEEYGQPTGSHGPDWKWQQGSGVAAVKAVKEAQEARGIGVSTAAPPPPAGSGQTVRVWGRDMAVEDVRLAAVRPDGEKLFLYTPHWSALQLDAPGRVQAMELFLERWREGEPIIVRGCWQRMSWDPRTMCRCTNERGNKKFGTEASTSLEVLDCDGLKREVMSQQAFFDGFQHGIEDDQGRPRMLKVKDWPQEERFQDRLKRHHQDFLEMLPCPEYTHPDPRIAPLNLAAMLPAHANATDLGPKTYVAYGRPEEHEEEGDSVTKMHQDMSDAINILTYTHYTKDEHAVVRCGDQLPTASWGNAGAVWDIARRKDVPALRDYLETHKGDFVHKGKKLSEQPVGDVIFDHAFMLKKWHHEALAKEKGVAMWRFEQFDHEAVFIPAGCPHAVRNLRSCVKIAVDFVSPESVGECMGMADMLRHCSMASDKEAQAHQRYYQDKLQARQMVVWGAIDAYRLLKGEKREPPPKEAADRADAPRKARRAPAAGKGAAKGAKEGGKQAGAGGVGAGSKRGRS